MHDNIVNINSISFGLTNDKYKEQEERGKEKEATRVMATIELFTNRSIK